MSACVCVGGGHGGREQSIETSVFKSAEQSVIGRSNFEIKHWVVFYFIFDKKKRSLSDEEVVLRYCCNLTSIQSFTLFHF